MKKQPVKVPTLTIPTLPDGYTVKRVKFDLNLVYLNGKLIKSINDNIKYAYQFADRHSRGSRW